jgi:hypothetical protein
MTLSDVRQHYSGWWIQGTGLFAVFCGSARRISLFSNLEIAKEAKFASCGRGCDRHSEPHTGLRLDPPAPTKLSASYRRMVESA